MIAISGVQDYLAEHRARWVGRLADLVGVPAVAGLPERETDLLRSTNWLAGVLHETRFPPYRCGRPRGCRPCTPSGAPLRGHRPF